MAAAHEVDLPPVENLRLVAGNQVITATWDAASPGVSGSAPAGYRVFVYELGSLLLASNTTETAYTFAGAVNGRVYVIEVAARDAAGDLGPRVAASTQPQLAKDQAYLALGLAVVWIAFWGYTAVLTKQSRDAAARLSYIQDERQRLARPRPRRAPRRTRTARRSR